LLHIAKKIVIVNIMLISALGYQLYKIWLTSDNYRKLSYMPFALVIDVYYN
jgi:hypothetical protein